jgi:hypothetical protein
MLKENVWLALQKIGRLIIGFRFLTYVFILIGTIGGYPLLVANADAANKELLDTIYALAVAIEAVVGQIVLIASYTKRPPVGLDYKSQVTINDIFDYLTKEKEK